MNLSRIVNAALSLTRVRSINVHVVTWEGGGRVSSSFCNSRLKESGIGAGEGSRGTRLGDSGKTGGGGGGGGRSGPRQSSVLANSSRNEAGNDGSSGEKRTRYHRSPPDTASLRTWGPLRWP